MEIKLDVHLVAETLRLSTVLEALSWRNMRNMGTDHATPLTRTRDIGVQLQNKTFGLSIGDGGL